MHALAQVLWWLDADRARFWAVAGLAFAAAVIAAFLPAGADAAPAARRWNAGLFGLAVIIALAACRWPVWLYPKELNPDEAQIVAGAITLERFPVYWKYVDGTTHGPVCEYLLLAAHWLGAPLNYFTARLVGTLLQAGALLALWGTLRRFAPERVARVAVLPALAFWSFVAWDDFLHYSTELPAVFCLAVGAWLGGIVLSVRTVHRRHFVAAALAGLALGIVPLAKLQGVPPALATALVVLVLLGRARAELPVRARRQLGAAFVSGGLLPGVVLLIFLAVYGLGEHFRVSYLLSALDYVMISDHRPAEMPLRFLNFSATAPAFACFFWGALGLALLHARAAAADPALRLGRYVAWVLLAAAFYSVLRPGREVAHYLHFLVIPLSLLAGFTLATAVAEAGDRAAAGRRAPWIFFAALTLAPQAYNLGAGQPHEHVGRAATTHRQPRSAAAEFIRARARPGDTLAMWGWEPHLLVETGLPHGTREAHTANQIMDWPLRPYYVTRYLWDMERRQPQWFVDVVGPGSFAFEARGIQAHETVPALRDLVAAHYELAAEFGSKRIYRRRGPTQTR
jgi:hypothetical protein